MKKLLMVSSSLDTGGAQKMISNITTTLPKDWKIDILLNSDSNIKFPYCGRIISLGIPEPKSRMSIVYQGKVLFKRLIMMRQLKKKNNYCACISLLDSANVANIITNNKQCKTVITAILNLSESKHIKIYKYIIFPLARLLYNRADCIIAQNSAIKDDMIHNFKIKKDLFTIIYNGIDSEAIEEICRKTIPEEEKIWFSKVKTIITAGRLTYAKGQWHLIRAFSHVLKEVPDAKLVIFGTGELETYLKRLVREYGIEDSVYIKGFDTELDKYIARSAVFAFPSMLEGMPTALLEAMACKTAVVITDFKSGAREILDYPPDKQIDGIIETKYGLITPVCSGTYHEATESLEKNEILLSEAMLKMLKDASYREGYAERGKRRSQEFDMKELIQLWTEAISG